MIRRFLAKTFGITGITGALLVSSLALACGPFSDEALFSLNYHPDLPLTQYAEGNLGILKPSYARSYLVVAYRALTQNPFSKRESQAAELVWTHRMGEPTDGVADGEVGDRLWLSVRDKVAGLPEVTHLNGNKSNDYASFENCQVDAYKTAGETLKKLIAQYGVNSADVKTWVTRQDMVFSNCEGGEHIPSPPVEKSKIDPELKTLQNYQVAAALFYAGRWEDAKKAFEQIAQQESASWKGLGEYMLARTMIRQATLQGKNETETQALLAQADKQLQKVLANPQWESLHRSSQGLVNAIHMRLDPKARLHQLGHTLLSTQQNQDPYNNLIDYTWILNDVLQEDPYDPQLPQFSKLPATVHEDELTDWVTGFQATGPEGFPYALNQWEKTQTLPWLVAALAKVPDAPEPPVLNRLLKAAEAVSEESPAYTTVVYYRLRLLMQHQKTAEAGTLLRELMGRTRWFNQLPLSARNAFLAQQTLLATEPSDFWTATARFPLQMSWTGDMRELPSDPAEDPKEVRERWFANDAVDLLNQRIPLKVLTAGVESTALPEKLQQELAKVAWVRAVILNKHNVAQTMAKKLVTSDPVLKPFMQDYLASSSPEEFQFRATVVLLNVPGLHPYLLPGVVTPIAANDIDPYQNNWWCLSLMQEWFGVDYKPEDVDIKTAPPLLGSPQFLTPEEQAQAKKERDAIIKIGVATPYLVNHVLSWAAKHPNDPRIPKALHYAIVSPRYTCDDPTSGPASKKAFTYLHKTHPNNEWTKKTPYWYDH